VRPDPAEALRSLLAQSVGRRVRLDLGAGAGPVGLVVGLDRPRPDQPLADTLVALLEDDGQSVRALRLGSVQGVDLLDGQMAADLRYHLDSSVQEARQTLRVRLSPGRHDLAVSYVAAAPSWRASYRLVLAEDAEPEGAGALLQGWGIFDNVLDEDLEEVTLTLTAGQPVSFVYDLYTPFVPTRPRLGEEQRRMQEPVELARARMAAGAMAMAAAPAPSMMAASISDAYEPDEEHDTGSRGAYRQRLARQRRESMERSAPAVAQGREREELFSYVIGAPVSVARGQSAMVPIASARVRGSRRLIYNPAHNERHPIAAVSLHNDTALTLERGPVTVFGLDGYEGEAMLPFTPAGDRVDVAYGVEIGVDASWARSDEERLRSLSLEGAFLRRELWSVSHTRYRLDNRTRRALTILVEHPLPADHELFDTPEPVERTAGHVRLPVEVPPGTVSELAVHQRRLDHEADLIQALGLEGLRRYLDSDLLDAESTGRLAPLLELMRRRQEVGASIRRTEGLAGHIRDTQRQIAELKLPPLARDGKEGELRARYVAELEAAEDRLAELRVQAESLQAQADALDQEIKELLGSAPADAD
jgi:hypothetical protein